MVGRKKLTRIVTCQGGIQLVAALAARSTREDEQKNSDYEYEDILVVYDLFAPRDQLEKFAVSIKKMAMAVCNWKTIVYLKPEQMNEFASSLRASTTETVFARVRELVGIATTDEIYLCRNWQFGNRLLISAYPGAEKICYGDSVGIYFSEAYFLPTVEDNGGDRKSLVKGKLKRIKNSLRDKAISVVSPAAVNSASLNALLGEVDFDVGYFLLPDILGEKPPMPTRLVRKELTEQVFRKLAEGLDADHIADRYEYIPGVPTVILMTSNFSEASRMSGKNEIIAYREFLERLNFPRESRLIVKPHPRDNEKKIQQLGRALSDLFSNVVSLTDPNLFFVPFEIFLMQTFRDEIEKARSDLKVVTFSTACLSLEALFSLAPIIGFGSEIVTKFFYQDYIAGRIRHERDLHLALQKLAQVA